MKLKLSVLFNIILIVSVIYAQQDIFQTTIKASYLIENQKNYEAGLNLLNEVSEIESSDPNFIPYYYLHGYASGMIEKYQTAIDDFTKAINHYEGNYDSIKGMREFIIKCYYWRAIAQHTMEKTTDAIIDLTKALDENNKGNMNVIGKSELLFRRGIYKGIINDFYGAEADLTKVIEMDNETKAEALYYRGSIRIELGNKNEGCLDLSKAGELGFTNAYKMIDKLCN